MTVDSPCIRECCLDEHKICLGCHRSLREICDWSDASDAERLHILARCTERREKGRLCSKTVTPAGSRQGPG